MARFKHWLYEKFLPAWCREDLLNENARLSAAVSELKNENNRLRAYINGFETAIRYQRRVVIRNEVPK